MTHKEALEFLYQELAVLEAQNLGPPEWREQWRDVIAALEAEPLAEGWVGAADLRGFGRSSYSMKVWTDEYRTEQSGSLRVAIYGVDDA